MEIVYEESLRTEDNPGHAVIVFEDQIGIYTLHKDWFKRQTKIHSYWKVCIGKKKCDNIKENKSNTVLFYINSIILRKVLRYQKVNQKP